MKIDEAIKQIEVLRTCMIVDDAEPYVVESLNMAVEALAQEPCEDAISRQDAVNACRNGWGYDDETIEHIVGNILELPPVTPIQRTGKWIDTGQREEWYRNVLECSLCGGEVMFDENYCPNCGAKMMEADE